MDVVFFVNWEILWENNLLQEFVSIKKYQQYILHTYQRNLYHYESTCSTFVITTSGLLK